MAKNIPRSLPERPIGRPPQRIAGSEHKKGLTIETLMENTRRSRDFSNRFDNAVRDRVTAKYIGRVGQIFRFTTSETKYPSEAELHRQVITKLDDAPWPRSRVAITCDCSDFKYRFEVALYRAGAAIGPPASNMEAPVVTNPSLQKCICKHLIVVFARILGQSRSN